MEYQNMSFLQDMFLKTQNICSWTMTDHMQLLFTNCPWQDYFWNLFSVSKCQAAVTRHFAASGLPFIVTDRIGFVWMAARQQDREREEVPLIHMLGPVFTSQMTEKYLNRHLSSIQSAQETQARLMRYIRSVPTISSETAINYAGMLHYCACGAAVRNEDVELWSEPVEAAEEAAWGDVNWHGSWLAEQELFRSIKEGRFEDHSRKNTGKIGNIGGGDPLRQAKNEMIVFAVICSRAAILGGVSSEGALNLSDYFVQNIENAETVSEVYGIGATMHKTYLQRVRRARAVSAKSVLVRDVTDYVETHIFDRITLRSVSETLGYTEYYISRKFKAETGCGLVDYVNRRKMQTAKEILQESNISISELSERLSFSSPSYFSTLFKKEYGVNPADLQKNREEEHKS